MFKSAVSDLRQELRKYLYLNDRGTKLLNCLHKTHHSLDNIYSIRYVAVNVFIVSFNVTEWKETLK